MFAKTSDESTFLMVCGRFYLAMEYSDLARAFGDIPWFDKELLPSDVEINYKPSDPLK